MSSLKNTLLRGIKINLLNNCWEWQKCVQGNGYGRLNFNRKSDYVHRFAYKAWIGNIPLKKDICHTCDNRKCINPEHLFVGSRKDNMQDAKKKGRIAQRDKLPQSKISVDKIPSILARVKSGEKYQDIAKDFGVVRHTINNIALKNGVKRNAK